MVLTAGMVVHNYRIVQKIAEGGQGAVYLAMEEIIERKVALKVVNTAGAEKRSFEERFMNEARILASMNHPNIVKLLNFFQESDDYYMVMEFCDGSTLRDVLSAGKQLDSDLARHILVEILKGLAHAHSLGVIHRDVKPSNIMLSPTNDVKITDFGISRVVDSVHLTQSGLVLGTTHYLSPEQIRTPQQVDTATDIYSAGVVFFEMLCGKVPFDSTTQSRFEIENAIVSDPLPGHELYPHVSDQDWNLIRMLTDKNPAHRPDVASVLQLLNDLSDQNMVDQANTAATSPNPAGQNATEAKTEDGIMVPSEYSKQNKVRRARALGLAMSFLIVAVVGALLITHNSPNSKPRNTSGNNQFASKGLSAGADSIQAGQDTLYQEINLDAEAPEYTSDYAESETRYPATQLNAGRPAITPGASPGGKQITSTVFGGYASGATRSNTVVASVSRTFTAASRDGGGGGGGFGTGPGGSGTGGGVGNASNFNPGAISGYNQSYMAAAVNGTGNTRGSGTIPQGEAVTVATGGNLANLAPKGRPLTQSATDRSIINQFTASNLSTKTEASIQSAPEADRADLEKIASAVNARKGQVEKLYRQSAAIIASSGSVKVRLYIGSDGRVRTATITPTTEGFTEQFLRDLEKMVKGWSFPISSQQIYEFTYRLSQ